MDMEGASEGARRELLERVEASRDEMVRFLSEIISVPAVAPQAGGTGEWDKVRLIEDRARAMGLDDIERLDAEDPSVPSGARPNLVVWFRRRDADPEDPRLLVVVHTDVVPPGDPDDWTGDPFSARVEDGRVIGRGTEDNGQSLTAALFAMKALHDMDLPPAHDVGLVMVADEEVENERGILHLVRQGFFRPYDLVLVPDHGEPDGRLVDVMEKGLAWVKVITEGRQCHPSMPSRGRNALRAAMRFGTAVDEVLHRTFGAQDPAFDHPVSSFEPTKVEPNVPSVNIVPGRDVFYIDCRVLPRYKLSDVLSEMRSVADRVEADTGTTITLEPVLMDEAAPPTPADEPIVRMLLLAIDAVYHNDPYPGGIGGGTCAAVLRRAGVPAAVWETVENRAHSPDEHAVVDNMVGDCKVLALLFMHKP